VVAFLLAVLLLLVAGGQSASASRLPTDEERRAVSDAAGTTPGCSVIRISAIDPDWAYFRPRRLSRCHAAYGESLFHHFGTWDQYPADHILVCARFDFPRRIGLELHGCRPVMSLLSCHETASGGKRRWFEKPSGCHVFAGGGAYGPSIDLTRLRWRGWGGDVAVADALEGGLAVRVRASRRVKVCGGDRLYTRLQVSSERGLVIEKLPRACTDYGG
jgi:DNA-binding transcriptional LysR family regulator